MLFIYIGPVKQTFENNGSDEVYQIPIIKFLLLVRKIPMLFGKKRGNQNFIARQHSYNIHRFHKLSLACLVLKKRKCKYHLKPHVSCSCNFSNTVSWKGFWGTKALISYVNRLNSKILENITTNKKVSVRLNIQSVLRCLNIIDVYTRYLK